MISTFAFARGMARMACCSSSHSEGVEVQKVDDRGPSPGQWLALLPRQKEPDESIPCLLVRYLPSHHPEKIAHSARTAPQTHDPAGSSPPEEPQTLTVQAKDIRHLQPMGSGHRRPCTVATCNNQCYYPSCYCGGYLTPTETMGDQSTAMGIDPNANRRCYSQPAAGSC